MRGRELKEITRFFSILFIVLISAAGLFFIFFGSTEFTVGGLVYLKTDERRVDYTQEIFIVPTGHTENLTCVIYIPPATPYQKVADNIIPFVRVECVGVDKFELKTEETRGGNRVLIAKFSNCKEYSAITIRVKLVIITSSFSVRPHKPFNSGIAENELFLSPDLPAGVQFDEQVLLLAKELRGENRWDTSMKAAEWVAKNIKYKITSKERKIAGTTLKDGYGDCDDMAALLTTILRANGVPARIAIGLSLHQDSSFHAWTECYTEYGWVPADTTMNYLYFGGLTANHIKIYHECSSEINFLVDQKNLITAGPTAYVCWHAGKQPLVRWNIAAK